MKTVYSRLATLIAVLIIGILLFAPMRFGSEDYLYPHPRSVRMKTGDTYALSYHLDAARPQGVNFSRACSASSRGEYTIPVSGSGNPASTSSSPSTGTPGATRPKGRNDGSSTDCMRLAP